MISLGITRRYLVKISRVSASLKSNICSVIVISLMLMNTVIVAWNVESNLVVAIVGLSGLVVIWIIGKFQQKNSALILRTEEVHAYCALISARFAKGEQPIEDSHRVPQMDLPLSKRELEILGQAAQGNSNKQIALHLQISDQTVKNHLKNIYSKLEVDDRLAAVMLAMRNGWIDTRKGNEIGAVNTLLRNRA
jgi:DNA-binding CsgD family transcriptional regulator